MIRLSNGFVFVGLSFSAQEQKILSINYPKIGFSPFNALLELLGRLPRVENEIRNLDSLGAPRLDVVAALLMVPEELQAAIAEPFPTSERSSDNE